MLTVRERAAGAYAEVVAQGRSRVQGVDDMAAVTDTRIGNVRRAELVITAARGTERHHPREPDDARLDQMLASLRCSRKR